MTTATDTDEHPIIFKGWSVRRILAGEKTQTRRVINPQPPFDAPPNIYANDLPAEAGNGYGFIDDQDRVYKCPYGRPGDALWVREAFRLSSTYDDHSPREYVDRFPIGGLILKYEADSEYNAKPSEGWGRLRSPIHMPRELCRLRLRVEDVRVERVQEIDAADAFEEGIRSDPSFETDNPAAHATATEMVDRFAEKWNDIHGEGAWEKNEWVWVISFSRITG